MATGRSSFAKRQRDMAKKARAAAKREKRLDKTEEEDAVDDDELDGPALSPEAFAKAMADLHQRYDDGGIDLDTFDEERADLMARMVIE